MAVSKSFIYSWGTNESLSSCVKIPEKELTPEQNRKAVGVEVTPEGRFYLIPVRA